MPLDILCTNCLITRFNAIRSYCFVNWLLSSMAAIQRFPLQPSADQNGGSISNRQPRSGSQHAKGGNSSRNFGSIGVQLPEGRGNIPHLGNFYDDGPMVQRMRSDTFSIRTTPIANASTQSRTALASHRPKPSETHILISISKSQTLNMQNIETRNVDSRGLQGYNKPYCYSNSYLYLLLLMRILEA